MPVKPNQSGQQPYDPKNGEYLSTTGGGGENKQEAINKNKEQYMNKLKNVRNKISESGFNSGYAGYSMSKRALEAYEAGKMPRSKWTKGIALALIEKAIKENNINDIDMNVFSKMSSDELLNNYLVDRGEWHHTSKMMNKTSFYEIDEDKVFEHSSKYRQHEKEKMEADERQRQENKVKEENKIKENMLIKENPQKMGYIKKTDIPKELDDLVWKNSNYQFSHFYSSTLLRNTRYIDNETYIPLENLNELQKNVYMEVIKNVKERMAKNATIKWTDRQRTPRQTEIIF